MADLNSAQLSSELEQLLEDFEKSCDFDQEFEQKVKDVEEWLDEVACDYDSTSKCDDNIQTSSLSSSETDGTVAPVMNDVNANTDRGVCGEKHCGSASPPISRPVPLALQTETAESTGMIPMHCFDQCKVPTTQYETRSVVQKLIDEDFSDHNSCDSGFHGDHSGEGKTDAFRNTLSRTTQRNRYSTGQDVMLTSHQTLPHCYSNSQQYDASSVYHDNPMINNDGSIFQAMSTIYCDEPVFDYFPQIQDDTTILDLDTNDIISSLLDTDHNNNCNKTIKQECQEEFKQSCVWALDDSDDGDQKQNGGKEDGVTMEIEHAVALSDIDEEALLKQISMEIADDIDKTMQRRERTEERDKIASSLQRDTTTLKGSACKQYLLPDIDNEHGTSSQITLKASDDDFVFSKHMFKRKAVCEVVTKDLRMLSLTDISEKVLNMETDFVLNACRELEITVYICVDRPLQMMKQRNLISGEVLLCYLINKIDAEPLCKILLGYSRKDVNTQKPADVKKCSVVIGNTVLSGVISNNNQFVSIRELRSKLMRNRTQGCILQRCRQLELKYYKCSSEERKAFSENFTPTYLTMISSEDAFFLYHDYISRMRNRYRNLTRKYSYPTRNQQYQKSGQKITASDRQKMANCISVPVSSVRVASNTATPHSVCSNRTASETENFQRRTLTAEATKQTASRCRSSNKTVFKSTSSKRTASKSLCSSKSTPRQKCSNTGRSSKSVTRNMRSKGTAAVNKPRQNAGVEWRSKEFRKSRDKRAVRTSPSKERVSSANARLSEKSKMTSIAVVDRRFGIDYGCVWSIFGDDDSDMEPEPSSSRRPASVDSMQNPSSSNDNFTLLEMDETQTGCVEETKEDSGSEKSNSGVGNIPISRENIFSKFAITSSDVDERNDSIVFTLSPNESVKNQEISVHENDEELLWGDLYLTSSDSESRCENDGTIDVGSTCSFQNVAETISNLRSHQEQFLKDEDLEINTRKYYNNDDSPSYQAWKGMHCFNEMPLTKLDSNTENPAFNSTGLDNISEESENNGDPQMNSMLCVNQSESPQYSLYYGDEPELDFTSDDNMATQYCVKECQKTSQSVAHSKENDVNNISSSKISDIEVSDVYYSCCEDDNSNISMTERKHCVQDEGKTTTDGENEQFLTCEEDEVNGHERCDHSPCYTTEYNHSETTQEGNPVFCENDERINENKESDQMSLLNRIPAADGLHSVSPDNNDDCLHSEHLPQDNNGDLTDSGNPKLEDQCIVGGQSGCTGKAFESIHCDIRQVEECENMQPVIEDDNSRNICDGSDENEDARCTELCVKSMERDTSAGEEDVFNMADLDDISTIGYSLSGAHESEMTSDITDQSTGVLYFSSQCPVTGHQLTYAKGSISEGNDVEFDLFTTDHCEEDFCVLSESEDIEDMDNDVNNLEVHDRITERLTEHRQREVSEVNQEADNKVECNQLNTEVIPEEQQDNGRFPDSNNDLVDKDIHFDVEANIQSECTKAVDWIKNATEMNDSDDVQVPLKCYTYSDQSVTTDGEETILSSGEVHSSEDLPNDGREQSAVNHDCSEQSAVNHDCSEHSAVNHKENVCTSHDLQTQDCFDEETVDDSEQTAASLNKDVPETDCLLKNVTVNHSVPETDSCEDRTTTNGNCECNGLGSEVCDGSVSESCTVNEEKTDKKHVVENKSRNVSLCQQQPDSKDESVSVPLDNHDDDGHDIQSNLNDVDKSIPKAKKVSTQTSGSDLEEFSTQYLHLLADVCEYVSSCDSSAESLENTNHGRSVPACETAQQQSACRVQTTPSCVTSQSEHPRSQNTTGYSTSQQKSSNIQSVSGKVLKDNKSTRQESVLCVTPEKMTSTVPCTPENVSSVKKSLKLTGCVTPVLKSSRLQSTPTSVSMETKTLNMKRLPGYVTPDCKVKIECSSPLKIFHGSLTGCHTNGWLYVHLYKTRDAQCIMCCTCQKFFSTKNFSSHTHSDTTSQQIYQIPELKLRTVAPTKQERNDWKEFLAKKQSFECEKTQENENFEAALVRYFHYPPNLTTTSRKHNNQSERPTLQNHLDSEESFHTVIGRNTGLQGPYVTSSHETTMETFQANNVIDSDYADLKRVSWNDLSEGWKCHEGRLPLKKRRVRKSVKGSQSFEDKESETSGITNAEPNSIVNTAKQRQRKKVMSESEAVEGTEEPLFPSSKNVTLKRKRGRPRKYPKQVKTTKMTEKSEMNTAVAKKKRGRPRKYPKQEKNTKMTEKSEMNTAVAKKKRGRPRKYPIQVDTSEGSESVTESDKTITLKRKQGNGKRKCSRGYHQDIDDDIDESKIDTSDVKKMAYSESNMDTEQERSQEIVSTVVLHIVQSDSHKTTYSGVSRLTLSSPGSDYSKGRRQLFMDDECDGNADESNCITGPKSKVCEYFHAPVLHGQVFSLGKLSPNDNNLNTHTSMNEINKNNTSNEESVVSQGINPIPDNDVSFYPKFSQQTVSKTRTDSNNNATAVFEKDIDVCGVGHYDVRESLNPNKSPNSLIDSNEWKSLEIIQLSYPGKQTMIELCDTEQPMMHQSDLKQPMIFQPAPEQPIRCHLESEEPIWASDGIGHEKIGRNLDNVPNTTFNDRCYSNGTDQLRGASPLFELERMISNVTTCSSMITSSFKPEKESGLICEDSTRNTTTAPFNEQDDLVDSRPTSEFIPDFAIRHHRDEQWKGQCVARHGSDTGIDGQIDKQDDMHTIECNIEDDDTRPVSTRENGSCDIVGATDHINKGDDLNEREKNPFQDDDKMPQRSAQLIDAQYFQSPAKSRHALNLFESFHRESSNQANDDIVHTAADDDDDECKVTNQVYWRISLGEICHDANDSNSERNNDDDDVVSEKYCDNDQAYLRICDDHPANQENQDNGPTNQRDCGESPANQRE
ncbi:uncharacterized protein [Ptychodera flava]|uniref:uncharacterized protein n=1 Tax=Ptychodera flava TaxID=63121 RepID=UPI003969FD49